MAFDWSKLANPLQDIGYGLTQGNNLQSSLQAAGQRTAQMAAPRAQAEIMAQEEERRQREIAKQQRQVNATAEWLANNGAGDLAEAMRNGMSGSDAFRVYLDRTRATSGGDDKTSLVPVYGVDAAGNPVVMQPSSSGRMVQTQMPEGVTISKDPIRLDAGTHFVLLDPITRQPVGQVPKDNYTPAYDTAAGGAAGRAVTEAQLGAPQAVAAADESIRLIDDLMNDPNLDWAVGMAGVVPAIPGTPQAGVVARIDQLKGRAFLEAFESLKGGGQITEVEGRKATEAIARLNRSQTKEDFLRALQEIKDVIEVGRQRAMRQGAAPPAATAPAPTGGVVDYTDYFGGR